MVVGADGLAKLPEVAVHRKVSTSALSASDAVADTLRLEPAVVRRDETSHEVRSGQLSPATTVPLAMTDPTPCMGTPPPQTSWTLTGTNAPAATLNGALDPEQAELSLAVAERVIV